MIKLFILPLPEKLNIIEGRYGLELCFARGIVRIHFISDLHIVELKLCVEGRQLSSFWDTIQTFDSITRRKQLLLESSLLLSQITLASNSSGYVDIPFEIPFPLHEPITAGFGPCFQLLPNSGMVEGKSNYHDYKAFTEYEISCTLSTPSSMPMLSSKIRTTFPIQQFTVYDPRLIPLIMNAEERRWKSHIGAEPIEYDIEVGNGMFGPLDSFNFAYRILVNGQYARRGVRIRKITFTLKETHSIGEDRCCDQDDSKTNWRHSKPMRVRGTREILKWSQIEYPTPENNYFMDTSHYYGSNAKYDGLAIPGRVYPGHDGIYVERSIDLVIPPLKDFHPSTPNFVYPSDDHICRNIRPRKAYISVRHAICVHIEMKGADSISIESGCYLAAVGKLDCQNLLKTDIDIVPSLDYNKITGGIEVWVPEYTETSDLIPSTPVAATDMEESQDIIYPPFNQDDQNDQNESEKIPSSPPPPFSLFSLSSVNESYDRTDDPNLIPHFDDYDQIINLDTREMIGRYSTTNSISRTATEMDREEISELVEALKDAMSTTFTN